MNSDSKAPAPFSLRRWSQRKLAAAREERSAVAEPGAVPEPLAGSPTGAPAQGGAPVVEARGVAAPAVARDAQDDDAAAALPPLESLTFDSDFKAFMQPGVDENVRRTALRTLLRDPRFNVMDGLDVYIDDYSKPDPIAPEIVRGLVQARYLFDPPKTRISEEGYVEDVVEPSSPAVEEAGESTAGAPDPAALEDARASAPAIDVAPACAHAKRDTQDAEESSDDQRA